MNVTQLKALTWFLAAGLTGGLFWYVFSYFSGLSSRGLPFDGDRATEILHREDTSDGPKVDLVALADVQRTFQQLNWTGKEAPPPPPEVVDETPPEVPRVPVADLIQVLFIQEDLRVSQQSETLIRYRDAAKVTDAPKVAGAPLRPGDRLAAPHDSIRLESIDARQGLTFVFDDVGREPETVAPPQFDVRTKVAVVGPEGVLLPPKTPIRAFQGSGLHVPKQTRQVAKDRYALGTEDMFLLADNYPTIVAREVRHRRHRDPKTGKYDGIELQEVEPGGTVARHGGQSGDVIKSINGHPVTSLSEAITFVKNNKDKYSTWEVVVENKGQTRTVHYQTPPSSQP